MLVTHKINSISGGGLTEVIFSRMSYVLLNNSSWHAITIAILSNLVDGEETSMMTL